MGVDKAYYRDCRIEKRAEAGLPRTRHFMVLDDCRRLMLDSRESYNLSLWKDWPFAYRAIMVVKYCSQCMECSTVQDSDNTRDIFVSIVHAVQCKAGRFKIRGAVDYISMRPRPVTCISYLTHLFAAGCNKCPCSTKRAASCLVR